MKLAFVAVAIGFVGCTSSPADELDSLQIEASKCGIIQTEGIVKTDATTVLTCMNDALANGTLAEASWSDYDGAMFDIWTYAFADGGRVRWFVAWPDDEEDMKSSVTESPSCAGPFVLTADAPSQVLTATGCQ